MGGAEGAAVGWSEAVHGHGITAEYEGRVGRAAQLTYESGDILGMFLRGAGIDATEPCQSRSETEGW